MKTLTPELNNNVLPLLPGETPLPMAPAVVLDDGTNCIPQHYLSYQHTKSSVENIIAEIECDPKLVLFVDEDHASIFIQVGIIGKDNYVKHEDQSAEKIVYGRRWRVEPQLPSSEIIQTAFLALSKAREHEIRELFKYTIVSVNTLGDQQHKGNITTPFSCHHDLPLIAMSRATNSTQTREVLSLEQMQACLSRVRYDSAKIELQSCTQLAGEQRLLGFTVIPGSKTTLPELHEQIDTHYVVLDDQSEDGLMYALMDALLQMSNRYVEEHFCFKGFARFSRKHSMQKISALSAKTRVTHGTQGDIDFANTFADANYETDSTRVPRLSDGKLGEKIRSQLNEFDIKYGLMPKNSRLK